VSKQKFSGAAIGCAGCAVHKARLAFRGPQPRGP